MTVQGFGPDSPAGLSDDRTCQGASPVAVRRFAPTIALTMILAASLLGWIGRSADVMYADGLRYISQARALDRGARDEGLVKAVDHPAYPLAIAAVHRVIGGDSPASWQAAAQVASILSALLLIVPIALVTRELFGDDATLGACLLFFALPTNVRIFADALSESTFLLFWAWGLWGGLRFLRTGGLGHLALSVTAAGLAYLTRPEGLLLPAALVATLVVHGRWVLRGLGRRGGIALVAIAVGLAGVVGPFVVIKGGLTSKPSVARLLGKAPRSDAMAVERQRPLEPGQTEAKTLAIAAKAVVKAVTVGTSLPLTALAILGLLTLRPKGASARAWTLLAVIGVASFLALLRLHATGGYCTPRHAMVLSVILVPASAHAINVLAGMLKGLVAPGLSRALAFSLLLIYYAPAALAPLNSGMGGYRDAGRWLAVKAKGPERVVDVTGWSQFYGERPGYTFENLGEAESDAGARWVVVRESHLIGPWWYCERLRGLVRGRSPEVAFINQSEEGRRTRVLIFDRASGLAERANSGGETVVR